MDADGWMQGALVVSLESRPAVLPPRFFCPADHFVLDIVGAVVRLHGVDGLPAWAASTPTRSRI
jgi:hypothetical protein